MQNSPKWRYWNVVMKHFYGCHNGLQPFPDKSQCFFLPTAALQVGPDGHEGDRMAGAEFPTDRKCKEGRRTHQWGIINLTLSQSPWRLSPPDEGTCRWIGEPGRAHGAGLPISFWGYLRSNPKTEQDLAPSEFTCWRVKGLFQSLEDDQQMFYVQLWSNLTHYFHGDKERICHPSPEFTQFNVLGLPDFRGC